MKVARFQGEQAILDQMKECDWQAGRHLYEKLLLKQLDGLVLCLMDEERLAGFCTYVDCDEIECDEKPWLGYVYVFPAYRGQRSLSLLINEAIRMTKGKHIYVSSDEKGLYEKYGFYHMEERKTIKGKMTGVYRLDLHDQEYDVIGSIVKGKVDRPVGFVHHGMVYPLNYGYVEGVFAKDGEEQDVYLLGCDKPVASFFGKVIGVVHRLNDKEDKWLVAQEEAGKEEIEKAIFFQERYFVHELYL